MSGARHESPPISSAKPRTIAANTELEAYISASASFFSPSRLETSDEQPIAMPKPNACIIACSANATPTAAEALVLMLDTK